MVRRLKVLLIFPPAQNAVREGILHVDDNVGIGTKPPLGIMYLGAFLRRNTKHDINLLDAQALGYSSEQVLEYVKKLQPDIVGISCWTDFWFDTQVVIKGIRRFDDNIHICLGGPHVSIYKGLLFKYSNIDSLVLGDGEVPFLELVRAISEKRRAKIVGLVLKDDDIEHVEQFYINKNLDELPFPDRKMLPINSYKSILSKNSQITTMITSRGCPHSCVFCKLNYQKTILRSAKNVVDEMEEIVSFGINEIEIYDDTFGMSQERVLDICNEIEKRGLKIMWSVRDRVTNASLKVLRAMKKAGCRRVHYGIESASDGTLKKIRKGITVAQAESAVNLAKTAGLDVLVYFMLGLPGEKQSDILKTIDFAVSLPVDYVEFCITVPYPGTELYKTVAESSTLGGDYWYEFMKNPSPKYSAPHYYIEGLSESQLVELRNLANKRFYFRPRYFLKQLIKVSSLGEFVRKVYMGLQMTKQLFLS